MDRHSHIKDNPFNFPKIFQKKHLNVNFCPNCADLRSFCAVRSFYEIAIAFHNKVSVLIYLFSKCVNVIGLQNSDRNMDESIYRTVYSMVRASYVNFTMLRGT